MKNVAVLTEDGAFVPFFRRHPREFTIQGSWNWLMHNKTNFYGTFTLLHDITENFAIINI